MSNKMPALFVGHGSPMNAIEDNEYAKTWARIGKEIKRPDAILSVSAHWNTIGIRIMDTPSPMQIFDIYGFPEDLYKVEYSAKGSPDTAAMVLDQIGPLVRIDNTWGIDHGTWSVLRHMYPDADIPVLQLSIDFNADASFHYLIGEELAALRRNGVMIFGTGNIVHNLSRISWDLNCGYSWAQEFDRRMKENVLSGKHDEIIHYDQDDIPSRLAFTTPEHFYPLLYVLGATDESDKVTVFNNSCTMGSISMTGYLFE